MTDTRSGKVNESSIKFPKNTADHIIPGEKTTISLGNKTASLFHYPPDAQNDVVRSENPYYKDRHDL